MKIKLHYLCFFTISLFLMSCHQESGLEELLNTPVKNNFNNTKTIVDVKDHYQIEIGENWKRELYFDNDQSRIYAADTTKNFLSSFIVDVTHFKGKVDIDEKFRQELLKQVEKQPNNYIIKEGFLELNKMPGYCMFNFSKEPDFEVYYLSCYLKDNDSYFLLSSTIYGSDSMNSSLKETISVFNSLELLNKQ